MSWVVRGCLLLQVLASLAIVTSRPASAQIAVLEPAVGYEYGYPLAIERAPGIINTFGTTGAGSSSQSTIAFGAALRMPDLFGARLGISPQLQYRLALGSFTSEPFTGSAYDTGASLIKTVNHFTVRSTTHAIDLDLPFEYRGSAVGVSFGPWVNIELSRSLVGTVFLDSPVVASFPSGGSSREFARGDSISVGHSHYGLEAGLFVSVDLGSSIHLEPKLYGRYDIATASDVGAKALSVGLALSLAPTITPRPQVERRPDAVFSILHRPSNSLSAEVHFTKNGVRYQPGMPIEIAGIESYNRQYVQLPSYIAFKPDSTALSPFYELLDGNGASEYSIGLLARKALVSSARELLNIIGSRMRSDAGAVLSLEVQSHPRSGQRVEQIRRYLHDVWGIGSERVQVGKAARFSNAEAADTIGCSSLSLLAPVATQWIERSYVIPQMGIEKSIVADRGLRSWEIEVHQGDRLLAHFGDHDNADGADIPNFDLAPDTTRHLGAATPEPLVATLSARDIEGAVVTAHDTLRLPDASEQSKNMVEREVLTFVFLPQSGSNTAATTDAMFAKLLSLLRPDAEISVRYPLDQSGQTPPEALTITERLVDELRHRTDLHPDLHLHPRASADPELPPYDRSVTIRVLQAK